MSEEINKKAFGFWAKTYESAYLNPFRSYLRFIQKKTVERIEGSPKKILDVGCGSGFALELLQKKFPNAELYGLDLTPEMLALAKERLPSSVHLIEDSVLDLPFKAETFDVVLSTDAFHHYPDQGRALEEMRRVVKPDGCVLVADPEVFFRFASWIFAKVEPGCVKVNTKKEMNVLFEKIKLKIVYQKRFLVFSILTEGVK